MLQHEKQVHLSRLPQNLHILVFLSVHILAQQFEQVRQTCGTAGAWEA